MSRVRAYPRCQTADATLNARSEHHEGFSSSIGLFHQIQASIQVSQQRIRSLRDSLVEAKSNLSTIRPEFKRLAKSSQDYDDMLQILGQMLDSILRVTVSSFPVRLIEVAVKPYSLFPRILKLGYRRRDF